MRWEKSKFRQSWLIQCVLSFSIVVGFFGTSIAAQFDAPYYDSQKKNKDQWATEEKKINKKLAALEKKFGKKPNIIYVLADDVGWGEIEAIILSFLVDIV